MTYADALRERFAGLDPVADDLLLLEPHEVVELLDRAPAAELAALLHADPPLLRYLQVRCPGARPRLTMLLAAHGPVPARDLAAAEAAVVWEVADLIAYERAPELYDERAAIPFTASAVSTLAPLEQAFVVDAGAGTGRVAFALAPLARLVVAVEPVAAMRRFVRDRSRDAGLSNLLVATACSTRCPCPPDASTCSSPATRSAGGCPGKSPRSSGYSLPAAPPSTCSVSHPRPPSLTACWLRATEPTGTRRARS